MGTDHNDFIRTDWYLNRVSGDSVPVLQALIEMPPIRQVGATFKKAPKVTEKKGEQQELLV